MNVLIGIRTFVLFLIAWLWLSEMQNTTIMTENFANFMDFAIVIIAFTYAGEMYVRIKEGEGL